MVNKYDNKYLRKISNKNNVKADVIILGCSLPGIVTAYKLKERFGDTMDIVVLDLPKSRQPDLKCNVAFQVNQTDNTFDPNNTSQQVINNISQNYLSKFIDELNIPLPRFIIAPENVKDPFAKLFQHSNGNTVECEESYHDFAYLNAVERFELNQYQNLLDESMKLLCQCKQLDTVKDKKRLLYYDRTMMEAHICDALFFSTSREVMRLLVRLVCGAAPDTVSVLFYLHQCYRTNGCKNNLDGANTRLREKLLGYCRKRIKSKMQESIAQITLNAKPIRLIRTYSDEEVVLETTKGEDNYVCNLLAMALRPDELRNIDLDEDLMNSKQLELFSTMTPGHAKKFMVNYKENFWREKGFSGDIFSVRGPIIWATEKPKLSTTGSEEKYPTLMGYLKIGVQRNINYKSTVLAQLVNLFGEKAAAPVSYTETDISDIYIPHKGHYVAMHDYYYASEHSSVFRLEWSALDVYADGDVAAALEAGHSAYLHLLRTLRPQALSFEDISSTHCHTKLDGVPLRRLWAQMNFMTGLRLTSYTIVAYIGLKLVRKYLQK